MGEQLQQQPISAAERRPPPPSAPLPPSEPPPVFPAGGMKYSNPPESLNPDPATLRDQWRFAIRQYSRWYSQAWGTAILAGGAFFALGWFIKGSNPLPSRGTTDIDPADNTTPSPTDTADRSN